MQGPTADTSSSKAGLAGWLGRLLLTAEDLYLQLQLTVGTLLLLQLIGVTVEKL